MWSLRKEKVGHKNFFPKNAAPTLLRHCNQGAWSRFDYVRVLIATRNKIQIISGVPRNLLKVLFNNIDNWTTRMHVIRNRLSPTQSGASSILCDILHHRGQTSRSGDGYGSAAQKNRKSRGDILSLSISQCSRNPTKHEIIDDLVLRWPNRQICREVWGTVPKLCKHVSLIIWNRTAADPEQSLPFVNKAAEPIRLLQGSDLNASINLSVRHLGNLVHLEASVSHLIEWLLLLSTTRETGNVLYNVSMVLCGQFSADLRVQWRCAINGYRLLQATRKRTLVMNFNWGLHGLGSGWWLRHSKSVKDTLEQFYIFFRSRNTVVVEWSRGPGASIISIMVLGSTKYHIDLTPF